MKPLKAGLFFFFCLGALILTGTAFSHFWRTNKDLQAVTRHILGSDPKMTAPAVKTEIAP